MHLFAPTRSTGRQPPQPPARRLPLKLPGGRRSSAGVLVLTPASAPLRSAALLLRTYQKAPPASARGQKPLRQRPRRCLPRRMVLEVLLPSVPLLTLNRKAG